MILARPVRLSNRLSVRGACVSCARPRLANSLSLSDRVDCLSKRTHHVGYVPPGFEVRAHNTPVKEQIDDEEHGREE